MIKVSWCQCLWINGRPESADQHSKWCRCHCDKHSGKCAEKSTKNIGRLGDGSRKNNPIHFVLVISENSIGDISRNNKNDEDIHGNQRFHDGKW